MDKRVNEPVELIEEDLDAVAGGFNIDIQSILQMAMGNGNQSNVATVTVNQTPSS